MSQLLSWTDVSVDGCRCGRNAGGTVKRTVKRARRRAAVRRRQPGSARLATAPPLGAVAPAPPRRRAAPPPRARSTGPGRCCGCRRPGAAASRSARTRAPRVVRNAGAAVGDFDAHGRRRRVAGAASMRPPARREIGGVVDQVDQRLAQQERVAAHAAAAPAQRRSAARSPPAPAAARTARRLARQRGAGRPARAAPGAADARPRPAPAACRSSAPGARSGCGCWRAKRARSASASAVAVACSSSSALPRIAASGLFISCVSVCTYCSTYCLPSSCARIVSSAWPSSPNSLPPGRRRRAFAGGDRVRVAAQRAELRDSHHGGDHADQQRQRPAAPRPSAAPTAWLRSMKGAIARLGLATVSDADDALSPSRIGAATCITVRVGVVRVAAGGARAVLAAQRQVDVVPARVVLADVAAASLSNTTMPRASVT